MEASQTTGLHLGIEIHQRIAAYQQVQVRYRRILDQVVTAKDDRPTQVRAKHKAGANGFKVFAPQVVRDGLQVSGTVTGLPCLYQRFLVHVCSVDLDPPPEVIKPERLGQYNSQGVGFLTRGTASTPDSERVIRVLLCYQ